MSFTEAMRRAKIIVETLSSTSANLTLTINDCNPHDVLLSSFTILLFQATHNTVYYKLNSPGSATCEECEEGNACTGGIKTQCTPGTYAGKGSAVCSPCKAGSLAPGRGASSCSECDPGHKCSSTSSSPCEVGYYAPPGSAICRSCPGGTYTPTAGAESCTVCPPGYQCTVSDKSLCSLGSASPSYSTVCHLCLDGTYSNTTGIFIAGLVILSLVEGVCLVV